MVSPERIHSKDYTRGSRSFCFSVLDFPPRFCFFPLKIKDIFFPQRPKLIFLHSFYASIYQALCVGENMDFRSHFFHHHYKYEEKPVFYLSKYIVIYLFSKTIQSIRFCNLSNFEHVKLLRGFCCTSDHSVGFFHHHQSDNIANDIAFSTPLLLRF